MAKRKGMRRVDSVTHPADGREVPIYLQAETSSFFAEVEGVEFQNDVLKDIRAAILVHLGETSTLEWRRIIKIEMVGSFRNENYAFGFGMQTIWVSSHRIGGHYLEATDRHQPDDEWPEDMDKDTPLRKAKRSTMFYGWDHKEDFEPPCETFGDLYLRYTDETWNALRHLQEQIKHIKAEFMKFAASAEGVKRFQDVGAALPKLLPAPEDDE